MKNNENTVNTAANTRETVSAHYLVIDGQRVPLTDELQKLYNKEINDARNRARREHSCACSNPADCHGDCNRCPHHVQGIVLSTDDERYGDGYSAGVNRAVHQTRTPEEIYMMRESLSEVMSAAAGLAKNGDAILLRRAEGLSEYQIAKELGMPRTTVEKYLNKIMKYLKEHRSDFINW